MKMPVLLIVDDEKPTRDALRMGFQDDYEVYTAANLSQASALLQEESPDLVLTDLRLGGESGMDVLKAAASFPNRQPRTHHPHPSGLRTAKTPGQIRLHGTRILHYSSGGPQQNDCAD